MKKKLFLACLAVSALVLAAFFYACPVDGGGGGELVFTNEGSTLKWNVTPYMCMETGKLTQHRVLHTVWYEPEEDPRQVIGYQLVNGIPFFDHIVFLYGVRIIYQNCGINPGAGVSEGRCQINGLHGCFMGNMEIYMDDWETYFAPVRDRGIKVIMSIVPAGHRSIQGVKVGSLFRWVPRNPVNTWQNLMGDPDAVYFANEEATARFIRQMIDFKEEFLIDGFAFDEEYYGNIVHVGGQTGVVSLYDPVAGGQNILRFMHDMNVAAYGNDFDRFCFERWTNSSDRDRRLIFENYEFHFSTQIPESFQLPAHHPTHPNQWIFRDELLDISFQAFYGNWESDSRMPGNWPRGRFGPASVAVADTRQTAPKPPPGEGAGGGILPRMRSHLAGNYGVMMYYCLRSRYDLQFGDPWGREPWPPNLFGENNLPETYFSQISNILHGMPTEFVGQDFRRRHQYQ